MLLAASRADLLEEVTKSLKNNYQRSIGPRSPIQHERMATRRAPRRGDGETAATLRELGLEPHMVESTVKRQREMGAIGKNEKVRENPGQRPQQSCSTPSVAPPIQSLAVS